MTGLTAGVRLIPRKQPPRAGLRAELMAGAVVLRALRSEQGPGRVAKRPGVRIAARPVLYDSTRVDFEYFFDSYVQHGMLPDIGRELGAAGSGEDAANFLCALGLLTYTEVMGRYVPGAKRGSRNAFDAFFRRLGPCYAAMLDAGDDPYDFFRNGMVHTYVSKGAGIVAMLDPNKLAPCGAFKDANGHHLVIEHYFRDFVIASARLYKERVGHRHPLIHIWAPDQFPYAEGSKLTNPDLA